MGQKWGITRIAVRSPRIHWLFRQVQDWQSSGIISPYQGEAIRNRYVTAAFPAGRKFISSLVWSVLGIFSLLLGTVLVIANCWQDLDQFLRILLSLLPLMGSWIGLLALITFNERRLVWRELAASANLLATVLALALIGQIYNIPYSMGVFFISIVLGTFPVVLLTRSISWVVGTGILLNVALIDSGSFGVRCVILALSVAMLAVPDLVFSTANDWTKQILAWSTSIGFCTTLIWVAQGIHPSAFLIFPAMIWATIIGTLAVSRSDLAFRRPLVGMSLIGMLMTLFLGTIPSVWDEWVQFSVVSDPAYICVLGAIIGVQLAIFSVTKGHWFRWVLIVPGIVFILGMVAHKFIPSWMLPTAVLFELITALVAAVRFGIVSQRRWWIHCGTIGFLLTMVTQFVSANVSLGLRAAEFLLLGGILVAVGYRVNGWAWLKK